MKTSIGTWFSALAVLGMAMPLNAADEPARPAEKPVVADVVLKTHGILSGALVNPQGRPVKHSRIQIMHGRKTVAEVRTDKSGHYSVKGLRSGTHRIRTISGDTVCRFWTEKTAPPTAKKQLLLTTESSIVRGQNGGGSGQIIGATVFAGTAAALFASVSGDNPVQQPPAPTAPASP